jgi:hypothetical protein
MKITRKNLREMIWGQLASESFFQEGEVVKESKGEEVFDFNSELESQFEMVDEQTALKEAQQKIEELKTMSEEFKRMKQLVDFRKPLLSEKDS